MDWHWIGSQVDGLALELQLVDRYDWQCAEMRERVR